MRKSARSFFRELPRGRGDSCVHPRKNRGGEYTDCGCERTDYIARRCSEALRSIKIYFSRSVAVHFFSSSIFYVSGASLVDGRVGGLFLSNSSRNLVSNIIQALIAWAHLTEILSLFDIAVRGSLRLAKQDHIII